MLLSHTQGRRLTESNENHVLKKRDGNESSAKKNHPPRKALGNITNKVANGGSSAITKSKASEYQANAFETRIYVDRVSKLVAKQRQSAFTHSTEKNESKDEEKNESKDEVPPIEKSWIYQPASPKLLPNEDIDVTLIRQFPIADFSSLIPDLDQPLEFESLETDFN
jgi:hypothetical protein